MLVGGHCMFLGQMCKTSETGERNRGMGVIDLGRRVYLLKIKAYRVWPLGRKIWRQPSTVCITPEQWKGRDHYKSAEKYSEDTSNLPLPYCSVYPPFIQVEDIALCQYSFLILKHGDYSAPLILVYISWRGTNHLIFFKFKEHVWAACIIIMGQLEPLKKNFKSK